jgi:hypothetical protein
MPAMGSRCGCYKERLTSRSVPVGALQLLLRTQVVVLVDADDEGDLAFGKRRSHRDPANEDRC